MGIYNEGILGFFRGKVGRVVGSVVRGVHYMKGLGDVRTDNPTQKQLDQRLKFALVMGFLKPLQGILKTGFKAGSTGLTSLNKAMAANLNEAIKGSSPNFTLDYTKFMISKGPLQAPMGAGIDVASGAKIVFSWQNSGAIASTDLATVLVYNPVRDTYGVAGSSAKVGRDLYPAAANRLCR
jgi:hypothetical protein